MDSIMQSFSSCADFLYTDVLEVEQMEEVENDDGTTGVQSSGLLSFPCHVSMLSPDEHDTNSWDADLTEARVKIFLNSQHRIVKGDKVKAHRRIGGVTVATYTGYAGDPTVNHLAQEFILLEKRVKSHV